MARIPRRGSIYYIQQAIPRDLHSAWGAKQEWRSLHTPDCETAKGRHLEAKLAYRRRFAEMRAARDARAQQTAATKTTIEPEVDWEGLEVMERHWQEVDARKETDPVFAAQVRQEAMIREDINDRQLRRDIKAEAAQQRAKPVGTSLSAMVERWAQMRTPEAKTVDRMKAVVSWFEDDLGRIPVEAITPDNVSAFAEKLLARTSPANARTKLRNLNTLLRFAVQKARIIKVNPAADITIDVKADPEDKVQPFDLPAIEAIFASPIFTRDARPAAGCGEAAYWLPLLALYTGGRLNELGQLRPKDIVEAPYVDRDGLDQQAWVIRIVADKAEGLKLKNASSARRVPIHAELIRLGFLTYVEAARANGQARIFPELRPDKYNTVTANWSKWFGRYLRGTCKVSDERMRFHSFRHAFKDYVREAEIAEDVNDAMTGHKGQAVARKYGSSLSYPLRPMVSAIAEYRVTGFTSPLPPPTLRGAGPVLDAAE